MAVDEQAEVSFLIPQRTLPWQPILWAYLSTEFSFNRTIEILSCGDRVSEFGRYSSDGI